MLASRESHTQDDEENNQNHCRNQPINESLIYHDAQEIPARSERGNYALFLTHIRAQNKESLIVEGRLDRRSVAPIRAGGHIRGIPQIEKSEPCDQDEDDGVVAFLDLLN